MSFVIQAIVALVTSIWSWTKKRHEDVMTSLGRTEQANTDLQGRIDALQKANKIRREAESRIERDPDGLLSDDGFRRKDDD